MPALLPGTLVPVRRRATRVRALLRVWRRGSGAVLVCSAPLAACAAVWSLREPPGAQPGALTALPPDSSAVRQAITPNRPPAAAGSLPPTADLETGEAPLLAEVHTRAVADPHSPAGEVQQWATRLAAAGSLRSRIEDGLGRMAPYEALIRSELRREGLPEELLFLPLIESGFRESAVSRAGATGLWQFMAPTARAYGLEVSDYVDERRDPVRSTAAAVRHLRDLHARFGSWHLALAAYNAGAGRVDRALRRHAGGRTGDEILYWQIRPHLPRETRDYVPLFLAAAALGGQHGHPRGPRPGTAPLLFREMWVDAGVRLEAAALAHGHDPAEVRRLNPHLIRGTTPPGRRWRVRVPVSLPSSTQETRGE